MPLSEIKLIIWVSSGYKMLNICHASTVNGHSATCSKIN